jgi:hypothetical protein
MRTRSIGRSSISAADDEAVLPGLSRSRTQPPAATPRAVVDRSLALRDQPPANLQRIPGPKAILNYLHRDPEPAADRSRRPADRPQSDSTASLGRIMNVHPRRRRYRPR